MTGLLVLAQFSAHLCGLGWIALTFPQFACVPIWVLCCILASPLPLPALPICLLDWLYLPVGCAQAGVPSPMPALDLPLPMHSPIGLLLVTFTTFGGGTPQLLPVPSCLPRPPPQVTPFPQDSLIPV